MSNNHPYNQYNPQYNPYQPGPPSQPYAQPLQPPPQGYGYGDQKNEGYGERFKPKKKINDIFFLILFIATVLGFAAVSGLALQTWVKQGGLGGGLGGNGSGPGRTGTTITLNRHTIYLLLLCTAAALLLSTAYLMLVRTFTSTIMHITLVLTLAFNCAIAIYYWIVKFYPGAVIFTVLAIVGILAYFGFRSRIPFASLLLQVVMDVAKHHKSVYFVAFMGLIMQALLSVWFAFTAIAIYAKWTPGNPSCTSGTSCSSGAVTGLIIFSVFAYLWMSQVIGNVVLATLAGGPFGTWYYFGPREMGQMPPHPTRSAFVRASTLSLGSIAFGSLIVTLLEMLRIALNIIKNNAAADGHPVEMILACCAECCVGCIQGLVEYFNRYAYIEIALYGKPYVKAAKDTWRLFLDRGIDALVNDSLVGMTMTWGGYLVGLLSSVFAYVYLKVTDPAYNADGQYTAPVLFFAFVIGLQLSLTLTSAIEAGVSTIFVGLGENPEVLAQRAPALFEMVRQTYPHVVNAV